MDFPTGTPENCIITSAGDTLCETGLVVIGSAQNMVTAAAWPVANKAIYVPFRLHRPFVARLVGWVNGTITTAPNVDVGIFDVTGVKLISSGATLQSGANLMQSVDITDTELQPGLFYIGMSVSGTGSLFDSAALAVLGCRAAGMQEQATAHPLPSTATFAVCSSAYLPNVFVSGNSVV